MMRLTAHTDLGSACGLREANLIRKVNDVEAVFESLQLALKSVEIFTLTSLGRGQPIGVGRELVVVELGLTRSLLCSSQGLD